MSYVLGGGRRRPSMGTRSCTSRWRWNSGRHGSEDDLVVIVAELQAGLAIGARAPVEVRAGSRRLRGKSGRASKRTPLKNPGQPSDEPAARGRAAASRRRRPGRAVAAEPSGSPEAVGGRGWGRPRSGRGVVCGGESPGRTRGGQAQGQAARKEVFLGDGLEILEKPGLNADDTMAEAARKTLLYHLQKMMLHEPGTREGEDPEELHDMRVATRRMRAALRVFEDYVDMGEYKPFLKVMRQTGRELGAVRDLDVFMIKTQATSTRFLPKQQSGLDPLVEAWRTERERARAELLAFLDGDRYQRFKEKFEAFLRTPGAGAGRTTGADGEPAPTRVGDVLPGVLFDRLALVKAYDGPISQPDAPLTVFHQLRITSKGLRYTLEFFQEVLGAGSKPLIERTKQVQDHLGDLQDAVVTCDVLLGIPGIGHLGDAVERQERRPRTLFPVNAPGVATYLAVKQSEIERLMHTFGPLWD